MTPIWPSAGLARFLYVTVGRASLWQSRLAWTEQDWRELLDRPGTEYWMSWQHARPTGYAELGTGHGDHANVTRIRYLGLLPGFRGCGLGGQLLSSVALRAWTAHRRARELPPVERVDVDTTELDSAAALPNYLSRGFRLVGLDEQERQVSPNCSIPRPLDPAAGRRRSVDAGTARR